MHLLPRLRGRVPRRAVAAATGACAAGGYPRFRRVSGGQGNCLRDMRGALSRAGPTGRPGGHRLGRRGCLHRLWRVFARLSGGRPGERGPGRHGVLAPHRRGLHRSRALSRPPREACPARADSNTNPMNPRYLQAGARRRRAGEGFSRRNPFLRSAGRAPETECLSRSRRCNGHWVGLQCFACREATSPL